MTTAAESARFGDLWRRCVASPPSPDATDVLAELRNRLDGSDRYFHNLDHIRECLRQFDRVEPLLDNRDAVELALWFHDAEYEPGDPTNERRSAALFLELSKGARPALRRRVCALILVTRHSIAARTSDGRYVEDIDLIGFGSSWEKFMHNGDLLRVEFARQTDAQYYAGQVAFLARLKRRPTLFMTDYFRSRYEERARENLDRLLAQRAAEGYGRP